MAGKGALSMSENPIKVVAFNGSPRRGGNTAILLRYVLKELEAEGIETELVELAGEKIPGCRACQACSKLKNRRCTQTGDIVNDSIEKMAAADGILLGSPTYYANITPELAALMHRAFYVAAANGGLFRRKVGAGVAVARRAGAIPAFDALNHFFLISQMIVPGSSYWNVGYGREKGEAEQDEEGIRTMRTLGQNMAWLLKKLKS
jgi:multimeric flavodoxin WrbA